MPFKANRDRRHHIPKQRHRVSNLRWPPSVGQFDGLVKLGPGCRQAANSCMSPAPYASSEVRPARVLCGRLAL
jgi:hypothetical protein